MNKPTLKVFSLLLIILMVASVADARPRSSVKFSTLRQENPAGAKEWLVLPFVFSTDSLGFTAGVGGGAQGYGQEQLLVGGAVWASVDEAVGGAWGIWDYRLPKTRRFFFGTTGSLGYYPRQRAYTSAFSTPGIPRPGSNDSQEEDYFEFGGEDNWFDLRFEYVLPMGAGKNREMLQYRLMGGMLKSAPTGGKAWNPMTSGVTNLMIRQYNRYRSLETDFVGTVDRTIHPVEFALYHNNTDFPTNPSFGSSQNISLTRDFGWLESDETWTFLEFEASKYFSLGSTKKAKQRVVALNFWTADTPTWEEKKNANGSITYTHRPPFYEGATLGGLYRMRAYPSSRFNGRSVVYTSAEYRYTPNWNPLGNISWLRFLKTDWWQFVGFVEGGRVADEYSSELLKDWKVDGGLAIRAMMAGAVIRLDVGFSDEGASAWVMAGHPF